jgi:hypothetical protein
MHGKPVKMITVEWVEGPDGEPVGVERAALRADHPRPTARRRRGGAMTDDELLAGVFRHILTGNQGITVVVWPGVPHALIGLDGAEMKVNEAELCAIRRAINTLGVHLPSGPR